MRKWMIVSTLLWEKYDKSLYLIENAIVTHAPIDWQKYRKKEILCAWKSHCFAKKWGEGMPPPPVAMAHVNVMLKKYKPIGEIWISLFQFKSKNSDRSLHLVSKMLCKKFCTGLIIGLMISLDWWINQVSIPWNFNL